MNKKTFLSKIFRISDNVSWATNNDMRPAGHEFETPGLIQVYPENGCYTEIETKLMNEGMLNVFLSHTVSFKLFLNYEFIINFSSESCIAFFS